jgi:hypothetical protein
MWKSGISGIGGGNSRAQRGFIMTTLDSGPPGQLTTQTQPVSASIPAVLGGKHFNRLKIGGKLTIGFGILDALTLLVIKQR